MKILLFIILVFVIMLIVQGWRTAYFARRNLGNDRPIWRLTLFALSPSHLSVKAKWYNYIYHYLNLASGRNLSVYKRMVHSLGSMSDEQQAGLDRAFDILQYYTHKTVIKYILYESWTLEEFRDIAESISEDLKLDEPVTPAGKRMLSYAKQFSRDYGIPLSQVLESNRKNLNNTDDEWILKRLQEKRLG